jgi:hypothetical protein
MKSNNSNDAERGAEAERLFDEAKAVRQRFSRQLERGTQDEAFKIHESLVSLWTGRQGIPSHTSS